MASGITTVGTFDSNDLIIGTYPAVTDTMTIASGQALDRGAVLGRVSASGEGVLVDSANSDGSEEPYAVLAEAVDTSGGAKAAVVYLTGELDEARLAFGGSDTADTHRVTARNLGMFFKTSV